MKQVGSKIVPPASFVAQSHAVYAGTCGFVVRLSKKPQVPAKDVWLCATVGSRRRASLFPAHPVPQEHDVGDMVSAVPRIECEVFIQAHDAEFGVAELAGKIGVGE